MQLVTLQCRNCTDPPMIVTFASEFVPTTKFAVQDTQVHMDTQFVAVCGLCNKRNWEVTKVSPFEFKKSPDVRHRN